ncbi:Mitochondrial GTPase 1 [Cytospora mali]|uniref:Mitochondrial GTPase 1 n=1 Tax=Cytospora mali TaxID=578113 RepID=A0A194W0M3_CYTMA|nr:Mitochondrial GTPase 1 [Valsa mali]
MATTAAAEAAATAALSAAKAAFSSATVTSGTPFTPRQTFDVSTSIVRSYFLGHHHAALSRMRRVLSNVGLVIECRDMRVPLTSWNPLLESSLMYNSNTLNFGRGGNKGFGSRSGDVGGGGGRPRILVYTHRDLLPEDEGNRIARALEKFHSRHGGLNTSVLFHGSGTENKDTKDLLKQIKQISEQNESLTGLRALVVGMPNAGKSTLLNRLRTQGKPNKGGASKVAKTGSEPGVTRKLGTPVRIIAGDGNSEGVFVLDTPGVFIPYVPDAEAMLKLTLVGCVKDGLVSWITVADYLLYHLNLFDPTGKVYAEFCEQPTNDVHEFLMGVARRTGKLLKGDEASLDGAADWVVRRWRNGMLGRFVLDEVNWKSLEAARRMALEPPLSMNQARKQEKEARKDRALAKHAAQTG